jgi:hypothetical protein
MVELAKAADNFVEHLAQFDFGSPEFFTIPLGYFLF